MDFQAYQRAFAGHVRDPRSAPRPPGASARRMKVYSDLLFNNVEGFLLACFPVCRKVLGKRRWTRLVRGFFRDHACHSPYFRQIPEEFLDYLQSGACPLEDLPPFLSELAHYEWVELELDTSDRDRDLPAHDPDGDLLAGRPLVNPVLRVLAYRWPVQRLSPRFRPSTPPAATTFLLAFRGAAWSVRFSQINAATARLVTLLQEQPELTGHQVLARLETELGLSPGALQATGRQILADLWAQGALLGVRA